MNLVTKRGVLSWQLVVNYSILIEHFPTAAAQRSGRGRGRGRRSHFIQRAPPCSLRRELAACTASPARSVAPIATSIATPLTTPLATPLTTKPLLPLGV